MNEKHKLINIINDKKFNNIKNTKLLIFKNSDNSYFLKSKEDDISGKELLQKEEEKVQYNEEKKINDLSYIKEVNFDNIINNNFSKASFSLQQSEPRVISKSINDKNIIEIINVENSIMNKVSSKEEKKRIVSKNWKFDIKDLNYDCQLNLIKNIKENNYNYYNYISKIAQQQIKNKILSYKHQDVIKNNFNEKNFINYNSIIDNLYENKLKCCYCNKEMFILYDISREMKQWSVDRIDNNLGHNLNNYKISCLECNLKKRCRDDNKFLMTKQLKIIKQDLC
jgi:hypothetical protein